MSILFGHPTGTPPAYNCALAHLEAGRLENFCVPWMPSPLTLRLLGCIKPIRPMVQRLSRRYFPPLANAPKIQGRVEEIRRLVERGLGGDSTRLPIEANEWLMRTMARHCEVSDVTVVHAYEDCSLWQFRKAKSVGKICVYDMPIGYYRTWEKIRAGLERTYGDWLPSHSSASALVVSAAQKREEMELADLVLVPSEFVGNTIREYHPDKTIVVAPYGTAAAESPVSARPACDVLRFLFVGQCSLRKGVPLLLRAWEAAGLKAARLQLVGPWQLVADKKQRLPAGVQWNGPVSRQQIETFYAEADVFVFPSNFEGRALVVCEALGHGLPVLTTRESGTSDLIDDSSGRIVRADDLDDLVESLRWFDRNRDKLVQMSVGASTKAAQSSWADYRRKVTAAVQPYVSIRGENAWHTQPFAI